MTHIKEAHPQKTDDGDMKMFAARQGTSIAGLLAIFMAMAWPLGANADSPGIGPERQQELQYLLIQDCGSCHGLRLKGGLGPPLLPAALEGKPAPYLKYVISKGMPGSAMPPWENLLSEADIDYLVYLLMTQSEISQTEISQSVVESK